jgi:hypothetical protein
LKTVFPDFELQEWTDASLALEEDETHRLFWRTAKELPSSLLILDTPDIDSDARVNWVRADAVRRSADVLIAVLTQQKYNDAAVKEFFRKAGDEDKAVLIVFNQCLPAGLAGNILPGNAHSPGCRLCHTQRSSSGRKPATAILRTVLNCGCD